jgi:tetratricopeptide (TPR) repeat protein
LVVAGLWFTRADQPVAAARPADPLQARRATPAPVQAPPSDTVEPPEETRPLLVPAGRSASKEDALAAQASASAALRANPDDAAALKDLGISLLQLGNSEKAIEPLEHAVRSAPNVWDAQFSLARAQAAAGRWPDAAASLRAARDLKPDDYITSFDLALALHHAGDDEAAVTEYRRAMSLGPRDPSFSRSLGISLERTGRIADSIRAYQEYLSLVPHASDASQIAQRIARLQRLASEGAASKASFD